MSPEATGPNLDPELVFEALLLYQLRSGRLVGNHAMPRFRQALEAVVASRPGGLPAANEALDRGDPAILGALAERLAIPESYFYRDPEGWNALVEDVLPGYRTRAAPLRAWCLGCARGEEAETFRMLATPGMAGPADLEVLATDVDEASLAIARSGVYGAWSLRGLPPELKEHFETRGDRFHLRRERLRGQVRYLRHNFLVDPLPPGWEADGGVDLVLCRNVLIYFHAAAIAQVFELFAKILRPGGHLMLASTDPWPEPRGWRRLRPHAPLFERLAPGDEAPGGRPAPALLGLSPAPVAPRVSAVPEVPRSAAVPAGPRVAAVPAAPRGASAPGPRPMASDGAPGKAALPVEAVPPPRAGVEEWHPPVSGPDARVDALDAARTLMGQGHHDEAEEVVGAGLVAEPDRADLLYLQGELRLAAGQVVEARDSLRRALFLDPVHPSCALALHRCASQMMDLPAAERYIRMAVEAARSLPPQATAGAGADVTVAEFLFVLGHAEGGADAAGGDAR